MFNKKEKNRFNSFNISKTQRVCLVSSLSLFSCLIHRLSIFRLCLNCVLYVNFLKNKVILLRKSKFYLMKNMLNFILKLSWFRYIKLQNTSRNLCQLK